MKIKGLESVLSLVNDARKVLGLKSIDDLPKGEKEEGDNCPIARALELCSRVDEDYVTFEDEMMAEHVCEAWHVGIAKERWFGKYKVSTPSEIAFFINDFDNNAYPEYEMLTEPYVGEI